MYLGYEAGISQSRVENMVDVNREELEKALTACRLNGIRGMIGVGPSIRSRRESAIGKVVENTLVRVLFGTEKHEMFKGMGTTAVVKDYRGVVLNVSHKYVGHSCVSTDFRWPLRNIPLQLELKTWVRYQVDLKRYREL